MGKSTPIHIKLFDHVATEHTGTGEPIFGKSFDINNLPVEIAVKGEQLHALTVFIGTPADEFETLNPVLKQSIYMLMSEISKQIQILGEFAGQHQCQQRHSDMGHAARAEKRLAASGATA